MGERKVEEDYDFIYRVCILRFFGLWACENNGLFIYCLSLLILKVGSSGLIKL